MTPIQTITPWLASLSDSLGLAPAEQQAPGRFLLHRPPAPDLRITVPGEVPIVRLFAPLGPVTAGDRRDLFLTLLEWNLLGQKTNGTALALSPDGAAVTLTYGHPLDQLDGAAFVVLIENFLATAQTLQAELTALQNRANPHPGQHPNPDVA